MELFKNTNYDFLGKKWPFIIASLILTVAGFASMAVKGLNYGIDFKGGALMTVKFAETPPLDRIREAFLHAQATKGEVSVQNITDASTRNEVEIGIGTDQQTDAQLNVNRAAMQQVLASTFGQPAKRQARSQQHRAGCLGFAIDGCPASRQCSNGERPGQNGRREYSEVLPPSTPA